MTTSRARTPPAGKASGQPSDAELAPMSREELVELGGKLDGVETVFKEDRWPVPGTKAEKRAERAVAYWLLLGGFSGLALLLIFLFWPWEYKPLGSRGEFLVLAGHPAVRPDVRAVDPRDRHRRGAVPEEVHPRGDLDPGPPRHGRSPEIHRKTDRGQPHRCAGEFNPEAAQGDRPVAGYRSRCVRARHAGRIHGRADQEPMEAGRSDRRRQDGRAVDVGLDPPIQGRDDLHGPCHRQAR